MKSSEGCWYTTIPHCTHCMFALRFHGPRNDTSMTKHQFWNGQCFDYRFKCAVSGQFAHILPSATRRRTNRVVLCTRGLDISPLCLLKFVLHVGFCFSVGVKLPQLIFTFHFRYVFSLIYYIGIYLSVCLSNSMYWSVSLSILIDFGIYIIE